MGQVTLAVCKRVEAQVSFPFPKNLFPKKDSKKEKETKLITKLAAFLFFATIIP